MKNIVRNRAYLAENMVIRRPLWRSSKPSRAHSWLRMISAAWFVRKNSCVTSCPNSTPAPLADSCRPWIGLGSDQSIASNIFPVRCKFFVNGARSINGELLYKRQQKGGMWANNAPVGSNFEVKSSFFVSFLFFYAPCCQKDRGGGAVYKVPQALFFFLFVLTLMMGWDSTPTNPIPLSDANAMWLNRTSHPGMKVLVAFFFKGQDDLA